MPLVFMPLVFMPLVFMPFVRMRLVFMPFDRMPLVFMPFDRMRLVLLEPPSACSDPPSTGRLPPLPPTIVRMTPDLRGTFFFDLFTCIPSDLLFTLYAQSQRWEVDGKLLRLLRMLRLFKLMRMVSTPTTRSPSLDPSTLMIQKDSAPGLMTHPRCTPRL